ncbi:UNKNOWN [Stylonychia lemnae]|uniref:Uncharacterized protein n=1 Tax=Stylonychia lemnae TaxID=5949 RepID=A0A078A6H6_STYLE|nr:UNKNOWN [Stylonychia lemnae]|eukprot:CDW77865.1 UNKNOWN [Stylonychia lemnae]
MARNMQRFSNLYDLKVNFNINLSTWREKFYAFDEKKQKSTNNAFKVLSFFLQNYEIKGFTLNFQLMLKNFDLDVAQMLQPKTNTLQFIKIGCSEIQIQSLIVLTQIPQLKSIVIHETIISNCSQGLSGIKDKLKENPSVQSISFYKNQICFFGQQVLFQEILPCLTGLTKLQVPTNQLKDRIVDDVILYMKNQRRQGIKSLNIGNNHFKIESLMKLFSFLTAEYPALQKLQLGFQSFESSQQFMRVVDIMKENKFIKSYNFEGCNLSLSDLDYLNKMLISNKKSGIKKIKLGLNRFSEEQLNEKFKVENLSSTDSSSSDDERDTRNLYPIMDIVEKPIESFYAGLFRCLKMY